MNTGFKREIPAFDLHLQTIHSFLSVTISFSRSADPMHMEAASQSNADTSRMNAQIMNSMHALSILIDGTLTQRSFASICIAASITSISVMIVPAKESYMIRVNM